MAYAACCRADSGHHVSIMWQAWQLPAQPFSGLYRPNGRGACFRLALLSHQEKAVCGLCSLLQGRAIAGQPTLHSRHLTAACSAAQRPMQPMRLGCTLLGCPALPPGKGGPWSMLPGRK